MRLYSENEHYKLYDGSMLDMLEVIEPNSIDSIITDPPYELNFMNKGWDNSGIAFKKETWEKCYQVLKPGGYLLAFGGSRTFHRIACAIEDAGFEIRDTIMWLYGSGFPKSLNIGLALDKKDGIDNRTGNIVKGVGSNNTNSMKNGLGESQEFAPEYEERKATNEWAGWGTALKPSFEPIIVARKPFKGSLVDNVIEYGVGGINIDECRIKTNDKLQGSTSTKMKFGGNAFYESSTMNDPNWQQNNEGRFPANTILTYDDTDFDEVCGGFPTSNKPNGNITKKYKMNNQVYGDYGYCNTWEAYQDSGSASRYFYCAKASKKDRDEGCDTLNDGLLRRMRPDKDDNNPTGLNKEGRFAPVVRKNTHPTVKPTELMQYLVRLVTPNGGTILDPFNGSGSTGKAVMYENKERNKNYKYIGIELTEEYLPIAKARIEYVCKLNKEKLNEMQLSIFTDVDQMEQQQLFE
jgi:site-specific DNA-methyltransferase (adenine-specific)